MELVFIKSIPKIKAINNRAKIHLTFYKRILTWTNQIPMEEGIKLYKKLTLSFKTKDIFSKKTFKRCFFKVQILTV